MIFGILFYKNGVYQETELEKKTYATNNFSIGCYFEPYRFWDFIIRQNTKTKRETPIFIVSSSLRDKMAVWNGIDYMYIIFLVFCLLFRFCFGSVPIGFILLLYVSPLREWRMDFSIIFIQLEWVIWLQKLSRVWWFGNFFHGYQVFFRWFNANKGERRKKKQQKKLDKNYRSWCNVTKFYI